MNELKDFSCSLECCSGGWILCIWKESTYCRSLWCL